MPPKRIDNGPLATAIRGRAGLEMATRRADAQRIFGHLEQGDAIWKARESGLSKSLYDPDHALALDELSETQMSKALASGNMAEALVAKVADELPDSGDGVYVEQVMQEAHSRLLKSFQDAEGRSPDADDHEYWEAYSSVTKA